MARFFIKWENNSVEKWRFFPVSGEKTGKTAAFIAKSDMLKMPGAMMRAQTRFIAPGKPFNWNCLY
ncbi:hypothetical protein [Paenibacillus protaetiae]|uniref:Uncharacterized protein n=1 Tax=Paenibacillus protaetiae TaxID=2509456 RepID=A0A4P6EW34_9BACL|nr:hypothetical protein [Paenibacillus protaetiae]QAY66383.1 hypothetical protein ET464_08135 [Paenibacillus protaetiae]